MDTQSKIRCPWCLGFDQYVSYHDEEWGVPVYDDKIHFPFYNVGLDLTEGEESSGWGWATGGW